MATPASSLPDRWVQHIWSTMRANYGARWDRSFPVPPCPPGVDAVQHVQAHMQSVQRVWAAKLGPFQFNHKRLTYGLDNLPTEPPNLPEFYAACNRMPCKNEDLALDAPKANPERVARELAKLSNARAPVDRMAPLRELHDRDVNHGGVLANGKRITLAQRQTYRAALGLDKFGTHARAHLGAEA